jgi:adenylate cyclase class 2
MERARNGAAGERLCWLAPELATRFVRRARAEIEVYTSQMLQAKPAAREIEIKLRVVGVPEMVRKLAKLGARAEGRVLEQNTLYDTGRSDFRRTGRLLRVRSETPAASKEVRAGKRTGVVTFKAPVPGRPRTRYKEKFEWEAAIANPREWAGQLRALGFKAGFEYEKYRSSFHLPGVHACLDETPIGAFLELEGSPAAIDRTAQRLGYRLRDYIRATYWELYAADCKRRGRKPRNLIFSHVKIR